MSPTIHPVSVHGLLAKMTVISAGCLCTFAAMAEIADLCTQSGQSLGISVSDYTYQETGVMSLKSNKAGVVYTATYALDGMHACTRRGWFVSGQFRFASGKADYTSPLSGTLNDTPNWYYDTFFVVGRDFDLGAHVLTPHIGLGFRHLHNDLRTNDIRQGYRRDSRYTYLPLGLTHKTHFQGEKTVATTLQYLHLIRGNQKASLADQNPFAQNVSLLQPSGYGWRMEVMLNTRDWMFGPTISYWNIDQSQTGGAMQVFEPQNRTYELGMKFIKKF